MNTLTKEQITWIESQLSNDLVSTDSEMIAYFQQGGLTQEIAIAVVEFRNDYLNDIIMTGSGPVWDLLA